MVPKAEDLVEDILTPIMQLTKYEPVEFDNEWNLLLSDVPETDIEDSLDPPTVNNFLYYRSLQIKTSKVNHIYVMNEFLTASCSL